MTNISKCYAQLQAVLNSILDDDDDWTIGDVLGLFKKTFETIEDPYTRLVVAEQFNAWVEEKNFTIGLMNPIAAQELEAIQRIVVAIFAE